MKKANQKRLLGDLAIEGGNFTTAFFKKSTVRDLFDVENKEKADGEGNIEENFKISNAKETEPEKSDRKAVKAFEKAIASVEDNTDLEVIVFSAKIQITWDMKNEHFTFTFLWRCQYRVNFCAKILKLPFKMFEILCTKIQIVAKFEFKQK